MSYYKTCPNCGARLDPGERCDCDKEKRNTPEQAKTKEEKGCKKTA